MNRKNVIQLAVAFAAVCTTGATWAANADPPATAKDAEAMGKRGVAYITANGKEKGPAPAAPTATSKALPRPRPVPGRAQAGWHRASRHGTNEKMVGKNFMEMKDIDGKEYIKERGRARAVQGRVLHGLQVPQPHHQEDRAEDRVLRAGR